MRVENAEKKWFLHRLNALPLVLQKQIELIVNFHNNLTLCQTQETLMSES